MTTKGLPARASATVEPCRFVKGSSSGDALTVVHAGANEDALGVTMPMSRAHDDLSHADSGDQVSIVSAQGEIVEVEASAAISAFANVKAASNGKAAAAATTGTTVQNILGIALQPAEGDGSIIRIMLRRFNDRPALS